MAFVAFLAAILSGWLLVSLTDPARGMRPRWAAAVLEAALGAHARVAGHERTLRERPLERRRRRGQRARELDDAQRPRALRVVRRAVGEGVHAHALLHQAVEVDVGVDDAALGREALGRALVVAARGDRAEQREREGEPGAHDPR